MASYIVRIVTHARRGAGTTASVRIFRLSGALGSCGPSPWMRDGFPTGSIVVTRLTSDKPLGKLLELEIGHDSLGDVGTGWLLKGVGVSLEREGKTLLWDNSIPDDYWFAHDRWLGESDAGDGDWGPTRVVLVPESTSSSLNAHGTIPHMPLSKVITAAFALPEVTKLKQGKRSKVGKLEGWAGEDAYFVANDGTSFGVSDGVSQWRESGVDAGLFSRALMQGAATGNTMEAAAETAKKIHVQGSATIALARINLEDAKCNVEALGDSRIVLIRDKKVIERTIEQEHTFGVPFQLSSAEDRDQPNDGQTYEWDLKSGDTIVAGTDGLFDNVSEDEIVRIVSDAKYCTPFDKAVALCQFAFDISQSTKGETPYSRAANEALNLAFSGGKRDDISVIVSTVL